MAFAMIDDLTGEQHPMNAAHRLTLHLDFVPAQDRTEIAGWDVASTDPRELLTQLGEHLSGISAPLGLDHGLALPGRAALELLRIGDPDTALGRAGARYVAEKAEDEARAGAPGAGQPAGGQDADPGEPDSTATGEAVGGRATDAQVRAWCADNGVHCSTHGKLNHSARDAYERAHQTSPPVPPGDEPPAPRPGPPSGEVPADPQTSAPVGTPDPSDAEGDPDPDPHSSTDREPVIAAETPEPAGRSSEEAPAPDPLGAGRGPAVAPVGDGDRSRPEQLDLAAELAADGRTPKEIVEQTGVTLAEARELVRKTR